MVQMVVFEIHLLALANEFGTLWCNFVFLDVHDVFDNWFDSFFNKKLKPTFSATLRFAFLEAACHFTTASWRRRMFLEFMRNLRRFWNVCGEFITMNSPPWKWTTVSL